MSKICKLIEAMLRLPPEVRFSDVESLLRRFGWTLDHETGSHGIFTPPGTGPHLNIPKVGGRMVKKTYLVKLAERLELREYYEEHCT